MPSSWPLYHWSNALAYFFAVRVEVFVDVAVLVPVSDFDSRAEGDVDGETEVDRELLPEFDTLCVSEGDPE